jgi:hypothetical protein
MTEVDLLCWWSWRARRSGGWLLGQFLLRRILLGRGQNRVQNRTFHARHKLHHARVTYILNQPVDDVVTQFAMGHLAAAETQARFNLVALIEEANSLVLLRLVVVLIHGHRKLDFLDRDDLLLLSGGAFALFLLIEIPAVVLYTADRRNGVGRNLHKIKPTLAGDL